MEIIFLVIAVMASGALAVMVKIALGFPHERYRITATAIRSQTGWPLSKTLEQPLVHVSIQKRGDGLRFTGAGEKPVDFCHLRKGEAERLIALIADIKAAQTGAEDRDLSV